MVVDIDVDAVEAWLMLKKYKYDDKHVDYILENVCNDVNDVRFGVDCVANNDDDVGNNDCDVANIDDYVVNDIDNVANNGNDEDCDALFAICFNQKMVQISCFSETQTQKLNFFVLMQMLTN